MKKKWFALLLCAVTAFGTACVSVDKDGDSQNGGENSSTVTCLHVDGDGNGACDKCQETLSVTFDFYAVNDLHGKFEDTDTQPGVDEMTTYLKNAVAKNPNTILLSSGDMWQGSAESNLTNGNIVTEWMNELDFASMTIGNHEYDWGSDAIKQNAALAEFPLLALNIYDRETNERVEYCDASVMVEKSGVKIGIIGAVGDCYSSIAADKCADVYFKTGSQLTALVKAESQSLRAQGADYIVYSIHDGLGQNKSGVYEASNSEISYYDVSLSEGYVDLVFEGHSHCSYVLKDSKGVYHLQGGGDNRGISHARVDINVANDKAVEKTVEYVPQSTYVTLEDDPIVDTLMTKYDEVIAKANKVLGTNERYRGYDELLETMAQLYYEKGVELWGDKYDIVLGGGYLNVRSPYELQVGTVTYGTLQMLFPFDNNLVLCSVLGAKLESRFFSDVKNYYVGYGEYGEEVKYNIDRSETYYVVVDSYSSAYPANGLTEIARYDEAVYGRDLMAAYIEAGGFGEGAPTTPEGGTTTPESGTTTPEGGTTTPESGTTTPDGGTTVEYPLTSIPDLLAIANALPDNGETATAYYVKGTITEIFNTTYGNMYIQDEQGNTLYVYGMSDANSDKYNGMATPPQVGDTVVITGILKKFVKNDGGILLEICNTKWLLTCAK